MAAKTPGGGGGPTAVIENTDPANPVPTLEVINVNTALPNLALNVVGNTMLNGNANTQTLDIVNLIDPRPAAVITNNMTTAPAVHIIQDHAGNPPGLSAGLLLDQFSDGTGASINITNPTNGADALGASTDGDGSAGSFIAKKAGNASSAIIGVHNGAGAAVEGDNTAGGHSILGVKKAGAFGNAGFFQNFNSSNFGATLRVINANTDPLAYGLDVDGNAIISGDLDVDDLTATTVTCGGVKCFRIEHPLDPQHKYLRHASIESSEMLNVYTGNVVLGKKGKATVTLPDWFEALNKDYRYNLTCIGGFAKVYIAKEIKNGKFQIAGGKKGMKISWQVSGVRHDQFAVEKSLTGGGS